MNIAVACEGLNVAKRFDAAECFTCYSVSKGIMSGCRTFPNPKVAADELGSLFHSLGIDVLICGLIDRSDSSCFSAKGIDVVSEASGSASSLANDYLASHLSCEDFEDE